MSDTEVEQVEGLRRSKRAQTSNQTLDQEAVGRERLYHLHQSRSGFAANVTRNLNGFYDALRDVTLPYTAEEVLRDVDAAMGAFVEAHGAYLDLASTIDPSKMDDCLHHMLIISGKVRDAHEQFHSYKDIEPRDSRSEVGTQADSNTSTTSSARARASAKKAALEAKLQGLKKWQELEKQRAQMEMNMEQLKLETKIEAAHAEESTLHAFEDDNRSAVSKTTKGFVPLTSQQTADGYRVSGPVPAAPMMMTDRFRVSEPGNQVRHATGRDGMNFNLPPPHPPDDPVRLQRQLVDSLSLPKVTMMKFDGDPLKFWTFMQSYDSCVGKTTVDDGTKLNFLFDGCSGKAAKVIESCAFMTPSDGYQRARKLLMDRFGNPYNISEAWIKKITDGPPVKANNRESLQDFVDDVRGCLETLKAMNMVNEIDSRLRMVHIVGRLPGHLQGRWRKCAVNFLETTGHYPDIDRLVDFLDRVARECNDPVFGYFPEMKPSDRGKGQQSSRNYRSKGSSFNVQASGASKKADSNSPKQVMTPQEEPQGCYICQGDHRLRECSKFLKMSPSDRLAAVREKRLCYNCLVATNHRAYRCRTPNVCGTNGCTVRHSELLHAALQRDGVRQEGTLPSGKSDATSLACGTSNVALPIVPVLVKAADRNFYIATHALLDPGSNRTFCTQALTDKLAITGTKTKLNLETLSDGTRGKEISATEVSFNVTGTGNKRKLIMLRKVLAVEKFPVFRGVPDMSEISQWEHLKGLHLPQQVDVELLIGLDNPQSLRPLEVRCGGDQEPYAVRTALGWALNGPIGGSVSGPAAMTTISAFVQASADKRLEAQVERFWKVDTCAGLSNGIEMSVDDKEVLQKWNKSARFIDGHYQLPIPFKQACPNLPDNRYMAEQRLRSLGRRLSKDPPLLKRYNDGIEELVKKGFAEPAEEEPAGTGLTWYLPHHNVVNVNKPDKLRIVFDCAAEFRGVSLNKSVLQGPDLNNKLLAVLLRFREDQIAVMGDIESMYHQVRVTPEHRDALRFLWWPDGDLAGNPHVFRMTSHLFGGVWCPSCATYALRRAAQDNKNEFPHDVVEVVMENFYVDDCLVSARDQASASELVSQLCQLLAKGGFRLTKWLSNSREVLRNVPESERAKGVKCLDLEQGAILPAERALGVHWNTDDDSIGIQIKTRDPVCTRRGLLSVMSSTYDPLGLVGPYVLVAKKIFQAECRTSNGWDDPMSDENCQRWLQWMQNLPVLERFQIKRCLVPGEEVTRLEVHHFSDASQEAYGSVCYLRSVTADGRVHCAFVMAKSRLAPIRTVTVPRLELMAAAMAVQMDGIVSRELRIHIDRTIFWTDSMIVLHYIRNRNRRFKTFVANRIAVIHDGSTPDQWRHVGTDSNPADDASRGLDAQSMVSSNRWSKGPEFLWRDESHWPVTPSGDTIEGMDNDLEVVIETKSCAVVIDGVNEDPLSALMSRYSCWYKLQMAVVWLHRFKSYCRQRFVHKMPINEISGVRGRVSLAELRSAATDIIKLVQKASFAADINQMDRDGNPRPNSPLRRLNPFLEEGILKVGGRIDRAPVSYESRHPMILPNYHPVTEMIVRYQHKLAQHVGTSQVLAAVREHFWIVKGRSAVRRVLSRCIPCRKAHARKGRQQMAPLPVERLTPNKPPFCSTGVDYFGPILVKRGRANVKRYGCLFTCLTTRAIHIEVSHSLELNSFLCALQRFISRRGKPEIILSDNGTNFRGGCRELRESIDAWNQQKLNSELLQKQIEWRFNPPGASHMGGIWERMIRSTRQVLTNLLKEQAVSDEVLVTFMAEAEKIVNDRPLTPVGVDVAEPEPLTPSKLLLLRSNGCLPLGVFDPADRYCRRWWRQAQYLADVFWRRWIREYIPCLMERQKWLDPQRNFKLDDLVLVTDENLPRGQWPLGRVVQTFPDIKGLVRSVEVRVGGTTKVRPIHKLVSLES